MIITLTTNDLEKTLDNHSLDLIALYDIAAEKMGITVDNDYKYDCTKINISNDVYNFYYNIAKEHNGDNGIMELNMLLLMAGPKVEDYLKDLEIEFQENAIRKDE